MMMRLLVFSVVLTVSAAGAMQDTSIIPMAMQVLLENLQKCRAYDNLIAGQLVRGATVSMKEYNLKMSQLVENVETILAVPDFEKPVKRIVKGDFLQPFLSKVKRNRELVDALFVFNRIRGWQLDPGLAADGVALARQLSIVQVTPLSSIYKDRLIKEMIRLYQKYRLFPLDKSCLLLHRHYSIPPYMLEDYELDEGVFAFLDVAIRRIYLHSTLPQGCEPTYKLSNIQGILSRGFRIDKVTLKRIMCDVYEIIGNLPSNAMYDSRRGEWREYLFYPIRYMSLKQKLDSTKEWDDI